MHPDATTALRPATGPVIGEPRIGVRPHVTVVIAAWRASSTIGRAVASALAQLETAEVVVVDDASDDEGATIGAAQAADDGTGRLTVLALEENSGPAAARNVAIAVSRSDWIAVLDADDFIEAGRFAQLSTLADQGYDLIADDLLQVPEGQPLSSGMRLWFRDNEAPSDVSFGMFIEANVSKASRDRRELGFLKPLMRRAFLEKHGLTYDEAMRLGEDYDLYAQALSLGARMRLVPWAGYVSVMRQNSLSLAQGRNELVALEASDTRLLASGRLSRKDAASVRKHRISIRSRIVWIDFIAALKRRDIIGAARLVLSDVRHAPHLIRGCLRIIAKRFGFSRRV